MADTNHGVDVFCLIGTAGAAALSWMKWHSVGWAIFHACWGWLYVAYYYIQKAGVQ